MKQMMNITAAMEGKSVFGGLGILILTIGAECFYLYRCFQTYGGTDGYEAGEALEVPYIFLCGLIALTVFLTRSGRKKVWNAQYTVDRLRVPAEQIFLGQALYYFSLYLILWFAQVAVAIAYCSLYSQAFAADVQQAQYLYLTVYRSDFLFKLLPVGNLPVLLATLATFLALSAAIAGCNYYQRRGESNRIGIVLVLLMACAYLGAAIGYEFMPWGPNLFYGAKGAGGMGLYVLIMLAITMVCGRMLTENEAAELEPQPAEDTRGRK